MRRSKVLHLVWPPIMAAHHGRAACVLMIELTAGERTFLEELRGLAKDESGREVLVGLTLEETEFYVTYTRKRAAGDRERDPANRDRRQVILAEKEARRDSSPRH